MIGQESIDLLTQDRLAGTGLFQERLPLRGAGDVHGLGQDRCDVGRTDWVHDREPQWGSSLIHA